MDIPFSMESMAIVIPALLVFLFLVLPLVFRLLGRMKRAEGIVLSSEARRVEDSDSVEGFIPIITYQYRFGGGDYTGTTESQGGSSGGSITSKLWSTPITRSAADQILSWFTPGSRCVVYPDMSDHSRSTLGMTSSSSRNRVILAALVAALLILAAGMMVMLNTQSGTK